MALKVYTLGNCDRCRAATQWLRNRGINFDEIPIRETPPTLPELRAMLKSTGDLRRLFNTAGRDYRELKLGPQLEAMTADEAFALLRGNGNLVKRPFAIGDGIALVGFDADVWQAAWASS